MGRWKNLPDDTLTNYLGELMLRQIIACKWDQMPSETKVIPIPPDRKRLIRRGFNPAGILSRLLAKRIKRELCLDGLRLRHELPVTKGLSHQGRQGRLKDAFEARRSKIAESPVLLVDDVMTSGATVRAASQSLLKAGAASVSVAVLARVPFGQSSAGAS